MPSGKTSFKYQIRTNVPMLASGWGRRLSVPVAAGLPKLALATMGGMLAQFLFLAVGESIRGRDQTATAAATY